MADGNERQACAGPLKLRAEFDSWLAVEFVALANHRQTIKAEIARYADCRMGGRNHLPLWLICLPHDKDGEARLACGEARCHDAGAEPIELTTIDVDA